MKQYDQAVKDILTPYFQTLFNFIKTKVLDLISDYKTGLTEVSRWINALTSFLAGQTVKGKISFVIKKDQNI